MSNNLRVSFMRVLRRIFGAVGGVLLSKKSADELIFQRDSAVAKLAKIENSNLKQGLVGIVVSKDRALQLYSLLRSYCDLVSNPVALTVIYTASTAAHSDAYEEVKDLFSQTYPKIEFLREADCFRATLIDVLNKVQARNIFFLVDDIVFIRNVDLAFAAVLDPNRYVLSLRHSPELNRSYTANISQLPPRLSDFPEVPGLLQFRWFEAGCEWADPWSLDGQILSTAEVRVIAMVSNFSAPNSFEAALKSFNSLCRERRGLCYRESKILNLPINRVQNECANLSGSISPEFLLRQWNNGMMMDTTKFNTHTPHSPHEEHVITFRRRTTTELNMSGESPDDALTDYS